MTAYTESGERGNTPVPLDSEHIAERWARRISRSNQTSYLFALALVRANKLGTEARDD